jgi:hypothetical protein
MSKWKIVGFRCYILILGGLSTLLQRYRSCIYRGVGYSLVYVVFLCTWFMLVPVVRDRDICGVLVLSCSRSAEEF